MRRLTKPQKVAIAGDYVNGCSIQDICKAHAISETAFYRLRREDEIYQAAEDAFTEEIRANIARRLDRDAQR